MRHNKIVGQISNNPGRFMIWKSKFSFHDAKTPIYFWLENLNNDAQISFIWVYLGSNSPQNDEL